MQFIVNLLKEAGLSNLESSYRPRNGESQEKLGAKKKQGYSLSLVWYSTIGQFNMKDLAIIEASQSTFHKFLITSKP